AGGFYLGQRLDIGALTRLGTADATGRDVLWYNVLSVIQSEPWSGVGSYRLGTRLTPPGTCELFASPSGAVPECPVWLKRLGNPWLIAHNVTLQQWAETGPLGVLGLFLLLGTALVAAVQARSALGLAVMAGLLVATVNDNTLLVPSPFFAEVFWIVAGASLTRLQFSAPGVGLTAAGLLAALSLPLFPLLRPPPAPGTLQLAFLNAPAVAAASQPYRVLVQFSGPAGNYRAVLRSCPDSCTLLGSRPFVIQEKASPVLTFETPLVRVRTQPVELLLYPGSSSRDPRPLGRYRWEVTQHP
ncbi:MAG: O-antigen ligase domain-containing protein, partial [Deinococcota bacterium]